MCLVVISDHYRGGDCLGYKLVFMIFDGENNPKDPS